MTSAFSASSVCLVLSSASVPATFHTTAHQWGEEIEKSVACDAVDGFREANPEFVGVWQEFQDSAVLAIENPDIWYPAGKHCAFKRTARGPFDMLLMRLPSGRFLIYPQPDCGPSVLKGVSFKTGEPYEFDITEITYHGQARMTRKWGRVKTYSSDLFQSAVQATARDILRHGLVDAETRGLDIYSIIHDEVLTDEGNSCRVCVGECH